MKAYHVIALALGLLLCSCGVVRNERSAEDLSSSKEAYEQCLRAAEKADQCEKEKAIYDADLAEYAARHKAAARYGASNTTINEN